MALKSYKWLALLGGVVLGAASLAHAQDSGALLDVLVRKGIINDQEAEDLRAELAKDSHDAVTASISGGKSTKALSITGRLQMQYAGLSSDQVNASTSQFFMRRVYFGAKANIGADWTANLNYDFSGGGFDKAFIEWTGDFAGNDIALDFGLRKVNFGYEETTSSGSLKAIERSTVTRYFVEPNNGRRLGAGSYRTGIFLDGNTNARKGKETGVFFGAAITNPQRTDTFGDSSADGSKYAGSATYNVVAYWGDVGYSGKFKGGNYRVGAAVGYLPDQGGVKNTELGRGYDMTDYSLYADVTYGKFNFAAEFLGAEIDRGATTGADASPTGYWIQPSYTFNDKFEGVVRYSYVDSDGRTIKGSDGIRTAPASFTAEELDEYYIGFNYYPVGKEVKFQLGYIFGTATTAAGADEEISGVRSQIQVDF